METLAFLMRAAQIEIPDATDDTAPWYTKYTDYADSINIIPATSYLSDTLALREQAASIIARMMQFEDEISLSYDSV